MNKEEARQELAQRITALRKEQGLSIRKFALMVGLSKDYIVDLEKARKSPTLDTLVKLSSGFNMTVSELLEGIGEIGDFSGANSKSNLPGKSAKGKSSDYYVSRF